MERVLKNLEYLVPLLASMPNWVKGLFVFWTIFTMFMFIAMASITYTKNKEKASKEKTHILEIVKTQINRLIEDYDLTSKSIVEQFPKEVNQVNGSFNARGIFSSGLRIKKQWETANEYKEKVDAEYRKLTRNIEDVILEHLKQKNIDSISDLRDESERVAVLHKHYEEEKKKFEDPARKADLSMNKSNLLIDENFNIK